MLLANNGGSSSEKLYLDDVFSTHLYVGNGSTKTINNGIDLAGKGGLVWIKARSLTVDNVLFDTLRGNSQRLVTNSDAAASTTTIDVTGFNANGFSVGTNGTVNKNGNAYVSWTFRKAPQFFDVVTYTGNATNRTIAHALNQEVGAIYIKRTDTASNWQVYHRSLANTEYMVLDTTAAKATGAARWNSATATSSVFSLGTDVTVNDSGGTYVAYLFASLPGISKAGSYIGNGSSQTINCGVTTGCRFFLVKATSTTGSWWVYDSTRGIISAADPALQLNSTVPEVTSADAVDPSPLGIVVNQEATCSINASGVSYVYLAIS